MEVYLTFVHNVSKNDLGAVIIYLSTFLRPLSVIDNEYFLIIRFRSVSVEEDVSQEETCKRSSLLQYVETFKYSKFIRMVGIF